MERIMLKDVCDIFDGPHATPTKTKTGPVYLGIDAITEDGRLDENEFAHLSVSDYEKWTKRVTPVEGDIVFSYEATLGRYAIIPKDFYGCLGRRLAVIRNKSEKSTLNGSITIFDLRNGGHSSPETLLREARSIGFLLKTSPNTPSHQSKGNNKTKLPIYLACLTRK